MVCILFEYSNEPCTYHPWMLEVQVMSVSWSQKPIVSPYQRGTSGPRCGTAPVMVKVRPIWMFVMKLSATPARICTREGVTMTSHSQVAASCQRRMKPSGQQYCEGHWAAFVLPSWNSCCTNRC